MSNFRVYKVKIGTQDSDEFVKFDDKQDAEHFAKNQSLSDLAHGYQVKKLLNGEYQVIKAYLNGQVTEVSSRAKHVSE